MPHLQAKIDKLKKGPQEFFKIDIGGGVTLDGWMMKPPGFDPNKKYPILFYVYGEPAAQTVIDPLGRHELSVAFDADAAGLYRRQRR